MCFHNWFSPILCIGLVSLVHASRLRGLNRLRSSQTKNVTSSIPVARRDESSSSSTFDCYVYEMDGLAPPGIQLAEYWNCEVEATSTEPGKQYRLLGDVEAVVKDHFQEDIKAIGITRMTVPFDAIRGTKLIDISHPEIKMNHDHLRQRRKLAARTGNQQLLIVRAIDKNGHAPNHWREHIKDDFFQDGNNLKTRLKECSNNKLNIVPATGPNIIHGVLNVRLDISFNGMKWQDVGDEISNTLAQMDGSISYSSRIFLMPDIVDFRGAAAWAQVGGNTIWLKDSYASYPIVQVHEYGHLLGQRHSGANGNSYSDNSCYMGNQVPWTDEGAFMCFNAAKTWHFGWYSNHHYEINPANEAFNADIVGIDDVVNGNAGSKKVIIKIKGDANEFYLMYNRAKGINREAIGGADEVVITKQNGSSADSNFEKSLASGDQWVFNSFGSTGKNLVVKNCYTERNTSNGDIARVLIYVEGLNDQQCGSSGGNNSNGSSGGGGGNGGASDGGGSDQCTDKHWTDIYGDSCSWYRTNNRCYILGDVTGTDGWKASEACCVCGGGDGNNSGGNGSGNGNNSDGGDSPGGNHGDCTDDNSWQDAEGYDCAWYGAVTDACVMFGDYFENYGKTANEVCCACKQ